MRRGFLCAVDGSGMMGQKGPIMPRRPERKTPKEPATHEVKTSARGYGWAWQKLRLFILTRDPLCRWCHKYRPGMLANVSNSVDHIIPKTKGGTDDYGNLAGCCHYCNSAKGDS